MSTFAKHLLILINVLSFILGITVITIGTWIAIDKSSLINLVANGTIPESGEEQTEVKKEVDYYFTFAALIIIGTGAFIVLLSLLGCFGAIKESKCLLITYASFVIFITLVQSTGIILSAVFQIQLQNHISTFLTSSLKYYGREDHITQYWNTKMEHLNCCGVNGKDDFIKNMNATDVCRDHAETGCLTKVIQVIKDDLHYAIIIAAAVILTEILGIAFALGLNNSIGGTKEDPSENGLQMRSSHLDGSRIDSTWM